MERGLVFFPEKNIYTDPGQYGLSYEDIYFSTSDGVTLNGWFVRGEGKKVLLWFHGNGGNIADRVENILFLVKTVGISLFIIDYREYGRSEGKVSKAGTFLDAEAAYRYLIENRRIPPKDIILFGRSLGSALAVYIAKSFDAGGVIIESAFTSSDDVAKVYYPFLRHLLKTSASYRTLELITSLILPKLIIHGEKDEIIPLWMGEKLYEKAAEPKEFYLIKGAHHNDTYIVGGGQYYKKIKGFIDNI